MTINGSATSLEVLADANIKRADLFIAITEIEEVNIIAAIFAKRLGVKKTIVRIDNKEYLLAKNKEYFTGLGIDSMVYPEILTSREIVTLLRQSAVYRTFQFSGGSLSLYIIRLEKNTPIINKTLIQASHENLPHEYRTVAITRGGKTIIPHGGDSFFVDDLVYIVTTIDGINSIMRYSGKENVQIKNMMILGGSRIAVKTAKALENQINIKLIEKDKNKSFELADQLDNTLVINSDGRDIDVMIDEGIQNMDAFIAVTGNSETNILTCMLAKKMGVKKTIAEIENIDYIELAENMGIDTVINKKQVAASHIFGFTMDVDVSMVQCLTATDAEILEFVVKEKSKITKNILSAINFPKGAIISGVTRNKSSFIAKGDTQIKYKDKVIVFALPEAIDRVAKFFG